MPVLQKLQQVNCLIIRGQGGLEKLAQILRNRGAQVDYLEIYKRVKPSVDNSFLLALLNKKQLAAVTITSGEALQNLLSMVDEAAVALLLAVPLLVISNRIGQQAKQFGFTSIVVTDKPSDSAILETLNTLITGENSGRKN